MGKWPRSLVVAFASWRCRVNRMAADELHRKAWEYWTPHRVYCHRYETEARYRRQLSRMWESMALAYKD